MGPRFLKLQIEEISRVFMKLRVLSPVFPILGMKIPSSASCTYAALNAGALVDGELHARVGNAVRTLFPPQLSDAEAHIVLLSADFHGYFSEVPTADLVNISFCKSERCLTVESGTTSKKTSQVSGRRLVLLSGRKNIKEKPVDREDRRGGGLAA